MDTPAGRRALRREMRRRRRALSGPERRAAARALSNRLASTRWFLNSRTIAVYLPNDGEIDLSLLVERAWAMGKRTYLPRLFGPRLWFLPFHARSVLAGNRFSIPEPVEPAPPAHPSPVPRLGAVSAGRVRRTRESPGDGRGVLRPHVRGGTPPPRMAGAEAHRGGLRNAARGLPRRRRLGRSPRRHRPPTAPPAFRDRDTPAAYGLRWAVGPARLPSGVGSGGHRTERASFVARDAASAVRRPLRASCDPAFSGYNPRDAARAAGGAPDPCVTG